MSHIKRTTQLLLINPSRTVRICLFRYEAWRIAQFSEDRYQTENWTKTSSKDKQILEAQKYGGRKGRIVFLHAYITRILMDHLYKIYISCEKTIDDSEKKLLFNDNIYIFQNSIHCNLCKYPHDNHLVYITSVKLWQGFIQPRITYARDKRGVGSHLVLPRE